MRNALEFASRSRLTPNWRRPQHQFRRHGRRTNKSINTNRFSISSQILRSLDSAWSVQMNFENVMEQREKKTRIVRPPCMFALFLCWICCQVICAFVFDYWMRIVNAAVASWDTFTIHQMAILWKPVLNPRLMFNIKRTLANATIHWINIVCDSYVRGPGARTHTLKSVAMRECLAWAN